MITFTFPSLRTLRFVQEFHILRFRFPVNDHSDSLHPREFIQTSVVTFKILQTSIFIFHVLINETPSKYEISKYERTGSHLDFLSGVVSCEQVKKEKKKKKNRFVAGPKITNRRIWRGREADEGSEYFLHAVPMGYTHTCTRLRGQRRVGHHRTATRQRTTC